MQKVDQWYGRGYYYGLWFSNEGSYWAWRKTHWDYPANRTYYNRHTRIYVTPHARARYNDHRTKTRQAPQQRRSDRRGSRH